jgi:hypothetical protein
VTPVTEVDLQLPDTDYDIPEKLFPHVRGRCIDRLGPSKDDGSREEEVEVEGHARSFGPRSSDFSNVVKQRPEAVERFLLFSEIPPEDCERIVAVASERRYPKGKKIFFEGDPVRQVMLLTTGSVKLVQSSPYGDEVILRLVAPGEILSFEYLHIGAANGCVIAATERPLLSSRLDARVQGRNDEQHYAGEKRRDHHLGQGASHPARSPSSACGRTREPAKSGLTMTTV